MRWATDARRPSCSARCWLCRSDRRSASFARETSRARSPARAACSWASIRRRADSSSWAWSRASRRRSPSSSRASRHSASDSRSAQAREQRRQAAAVEHADGEGGEVRSCGRRARASAAAARLFREQTLDVTPRRAARAASRAIRCRSARAWSSDAAPDWHEREDPGLAKALPVRGEVRRRPLEGGAEAAHAVAGFSPRWRWAIPAVRAVQRTPAKPASSQQRAEGRRIRERGHRRRQVRHRRRASPLTSPPTRGSTCRK